MNLNWYLIDYRELRLPRNDLQEMVISSVEHVHQKTYTDFNQLCEYITGIVEKLNRNRAKYSRPVYVEIAEDTKAIVIYEQLKKNKRYLCKIWSLKIGGPLFTYPRLQDSPNVYFFPPMPIEVIQQLAGIKSDDHENVSE